MPVVNRCSYLRKLVNTFFLSESATGSVSVEGLVSSPRVVGGQKVLKGMFYLWHQRAWRQTASTKQIRSAWRTSGLWQLNKQIDIDPRTPPPQNAAEDPLTPYGLRILRPNNLAARIALRKRHWKRHWRKKRN